MAVGCKDENTEEIFEMKKEILDDYMKGFQERNPNLKVYNAADGGAIVTITLYL